MEAKEALTSTAADMANVAAEKRSLLQQWQAALLAVRQRDAALQVQLLLPCILTSRHVPDRATKLCARYICRYILYDSPFIMIIIIISGPANV